MLCFLLSLVSTNPWGSPEIFGAICDVLATILIVGCIVRFVRRKRWERGKV